MPRLLRVARADQRSFLSDPGAQWDENHRKQDELRARIRKNGGKHSGAHECSCYDCAFLPAQLQTWMDIANAERKEQESEPDFNVSKLANALLHLQRAREREQERLSRTILPPKKLKPQRKNRV